ncbi:uncharacterized protein LOC114284061 [Camellia sinensis]|uniref:uncharacterized protein LOC114284061 n=1 Tax=Camellia sinensis TaxID=4442 RepID=UPI0010368FC4|nr:uncharacterized protein LOC114284061 [Camellia sinensis]
MTQPPGFEDPIHPSYVCKLNKALYGLKQAPRAWYNTFSSHLLSLGNNSSHISSLITQLNSVFALKDLVPISYFLGIQVTHTPSGLFLSQPKYAIDILTKAGMLDCKPYSSPMSLKNSATADSSLLFSNPSLYRSLVSVLQYLTITRPDLAISVNQACQFMHTPTNGHFCAVKRLLRYLKGTLSHGLCFTLGSFDLQVFSDADWAGDSSDRRSISGYCVFFGPNLISWAAKKQPTVARSSTEAEYRSLAQATAKVSWLKMLIADMHVPLSIPTVWCDNISAISLVSNPVFQA